MNLPSDFLGRFETARTFTGAFAEAAPWQRHVILHGGKFYASNNKQIVEIDCGVEGSAILTKKMLTLIKAIQGTPTTIEIGEWVHFGWENGRYLKVKNDYDHDDVVSRLIELLDQWHGTEHVTAVDLKGTPGRGIAVTEGPAVTNGALPPRKGFLYCGKGTPSSRLVHGDVDLRLDDLFQIKLDELEATKKAIKREVDRLADEQVRIEQLQDAARKKLEAHQRDVDRLNEALAKYRSGAELDDGDRELLQPACETTIRKDESIERRETLKEVKKELRSKMGEWDLYSDRSDGEYAYVTYRRRLAPMETRPTIKKRIAETVDQVFAPDFPRDALFKVWPSLGSIEARAGPS